MSNISMSPSPDGKYVVITVVGQGMPTLNIPVPAEETGLFVMSMLHEAIKCADIVRKKSELANPEAGDEPPHYVAAHAIGMGETSDRSDLVVLSFAVGSTEIGLGMSKEHLRGVGQSLIAMSADPQISN